MDQALQSPTFCFYPFIQMSTVPAGFTKPCCFFEDVIKDSSGAKMRVDKHDFQAIWNSQQMQDIRAKMVRGEKIAGCSQCYREEEASGMSMRLRGHKEWGSKPHIKELVEKSLDSSVTEHLPKILELKPGNVCNLKCRMCNKFDSNQIGKELEEIALEQPWLNPKDYDRVKSRMLFDVDFNLDDMAEWGHAKDFWKSVEQIIPGLDRIGFAGGESSLIKEVRDVLRYCVDSGHASHINVFYTSNLTRLNDEVLELGRKFRTFTFVASIDGVGKTQEYIRHPSHWRDIENNFRTIKNMVDQDQWRVIANYTVQTYNIANLVDFLNWMEAHHARAPHFVYNPVSLNLLTHPSFLDIQYLPPRVRKYASRRLDDYWKYSKLKQFKDFEVRLQMIRNLLWQEPSKGADRQMMEFLDFTRILDQHRKQNLPDLDPFLFYAIADSVDVEIGKSLQKIGKKVKRHLIERPIDKVKGALRVY